MSLLRLDRLSWNTWRILVRALALVASALLVLALPPFQALLSPRQALFTLDPLLTIASTLAQRQLPALWWVGSILVVLTLWLGRVWCGWLCPLGTLLDVFSLRRYRGLHNLWQNHFRKIKYFLLIVILGLALAGNLTSLILDPLTLFARTLAGAVWPWMDYGIQQLEQWLYPIPALSQWVVRLDRFLRPAVLSDDPSATLRNLWLLLPILLIIGLNLVAERGWCRSICPLGALLGLLGRVSWVQRRIDSDCVGCGACADVCPMGTIDPDQDYKSDPAECSLCMLCVDSCPGGNNPVTFSRPLPVHQDYDLGRREAIYIVGAAFFGGVGLRFDASSTEREQALVRPPAVLERDLQARCIRCGLCLDVCPTGALQPAMHSSDVEGFWTPELVPRQGYCDYSCVACGEICPVGAIPNLRLETKRKVVLGVAVLDKDRCLAWAEETACIVCEEMCPLPEKAIRLESVAEKDTEHLQPIVLAEECIGCGICEFKCPVEGVAAIQVMALECDSSLSA